MLVKPPKKNSNLNNLDTKVVAYILFVVLAIVFVVGVSQNQSRDAKSKQAAQDALIAATSQRSNECNYPIGSHAFRQIEATSTAACEAWQADIARKVEKKDAAATALCKPYGGVSRYNGNVYSSDYYSINCNDSIREFDWDDDKEVWQESPDSKKCARFNDLPASQLPIGCYSFFNYNPPVESGYSSGTYYVN